MVHNRSDWLDIVKGIGILLIVIGHIVTGAIVDFLYLFHVPVFFFLSGYLYKQPESIKQYITNKFKRLLIPYFIFLTSFTILLILQQLIIKNNTDEIVMYIQSALLGGQYLTGWFSVFWFITSLFFTQVIYVYLQLFNKKVIRIIVFFSLGSAYFSALYVPDFLTLWSLNTVLFTLPIYFFGHLCAGYPFKVLIRLSLVLIICISPVYWLYPELFNVDIKQVKYGTPVLALVLSLVLVIITFYIAKLMQFSAKISSVFVCLGGMSMTIMYMHQPIQITLKYMVKVKSEIPLVIVTIILCILSHYIIQKSKLIISGLNRQVSLGK